VHLICVSSDLLSPQDLNANQLLEALNIFRLQHWSKREGMSSCWLVARAAIGEKKYQKSLDALPITADRLQVRTVHLHVRQI
jgi:hypothetical protein